MSPQNIMVSFEGEMKVVDFGIAKAESQLENTRAGTLKGKFGYMSPEQADGQPIDLRTDIFSLGIVLWELLANDSPVRREQRAQYTSQNSGLSDSIFKKNQSQHSRRA